MLRKKSITDLRAIAQGYGIPDIFKKTDIQLIQAIELKQKDMTPEPEASIPQPQYDARLMDKPPAKKSDRQLIRELLQNHLNAGLHLSFTDEEWHMKHGKKSDSGTIRMPLRTVLNCANNVMK